jgi:hypothetical protein
MAGSGRDLDSPIRPARTCRTYNFKGALRAPGRGWPPSMGKLRAKPALTVWRRSDVRPDTPGLLISNMGG